MGFGLGSLNPVRVVSNAVSTAKDVKDKVVDSASTVGSAVVNTAKGTAALIGDTAKSAGDAVSNLGSGVVDTVKSAGSAVSDTVKSVGSTVSDTVKSAGDLVTDTAKGAGDLVVDTVKGAGDVIGGGVKAVKDNWTDIRDTTEAAAVVGGNYFLPGSSLLTKRLVSDGAQEKLNTDLGKVAQLGSSIAGVENLGTVADPNAVPVEDAVATTTAAETANTANTTTTYSAVPQATEGPPVWDVTPGAVAAGTAQTIGSEAAVGSSAGALASQLLSSAGTAALVTMGAQELAKAMTPEIVQEPSNAITPDKMMDWTAGERRATAAEIADVENFQAQASQRKRVTGAAVLSKTAPGSANVGAKQLIGA